MTSQIPSSPGFWTTVRLLLGATRKRAAGRRKRQQELLQNRGKNAIDWGGLGLFLTVILMVVLNIGAAFAVRTDFTSGARNAAERQGRIAVSSRFLHEVKATEATALIFSPVDASLTLDYSFEAHQIADELGGSAAAIEQKLRDAVRNHGSRDFITRDDPSFELSTLPTAGAFPAMLGSIALVWWGVMLVFQGEGLELDLQRRRHPMWEFLFAHPVPLVAVFLSEMLSPIAANPVYLV